MPFINDIANTVLNVLLGKASGMSAKSTVYIALGNVPVDENNDPVFDVKADALGFVELQALIGDDPETAVKTGYGRILVARRTSTTNDNGVTTTEIDTMFPQLGSAADRKLKNTMQINWTKAAVDWDRINAFALSTYSNVGETAGIYFVGGLTLTEEDKAAGGLLVEAGAVALFDPESFSIEFPAKDVEIDVKTAE